MNRNIIIFTILSLALVVFGIFLTTFGIIKLSNITVEKGFTSTSLDDQFDLLIYTPPAYSLHFRQEYPVLYLLDGEDYFIERKEERRAKWSMQRTLDRLIKEERLPGLIVVGITPSNKRVNYYTPPLDTMTQDSGQAGEFATFIAGELKPYIDTKYRTRSGVEETGIAGAGLGGLAALSIGESHADTFAKIGTLYPLKDELDSALSVKAWATEVENLHRHLLSSGLYNEQDIYIDLEQYLGDDEQVLDQHLERLLLYLFSEQKDQ